KEKGLSIMAFSGYYKEQLEEMNKEGWKELYEVTDLFIDGPFERDYIDKERPWVGSMNQRFHFLTERYKHLEHKLTMIHDKLEIYVQNRSEEHTSELQSRFDIVCRLLLEKKT